MTPETSTRGGGGGPHAAPGAAPEESGPTPEQQAAVDADGPEILVVAGAGTGKTRTLVDRYLRLVRRHDLPSIVAVTFTEAAATEMRERIRAAIAADPELSRWSARLDEAPIGTIHSLCHRMLMEHAAEAGFDPGMRVLGEDEAEFERVAACADALEAASASVDAAEAILWVADENGPESVLDVLIEMVRARDDVGAALATMGATPSARRAHARAACDAAVDEHRDAVLELVERLGGCRCSDPTDLLYGPWATVVERLSGLGSDTVGFAEALADVAAVIGPVRGGKVANWTPGPDVVRSILKAIGAHADEVASLRWSEADEQALRVVAALEIVFRDAVDRYAGRKAKLGAVDFLDLETAARDLLRANPSVVKGYQRAFTHVLIDEYQDTNPIQVEIIGLLAGDGSAVSRFYVGDAKQAIYGFRGGDVRGFNEARSRLRQAGVPEVRLSTSFRSHAGLVGAVNRLFESVFAGATRDFEVPMERLVGREGEPPAGPHVTVFTTDREKGDRDEARTRFEAHLVAAEIRELLGSGRPVWDAALHDWRPVAPRDVAILLRRFTKVGRFEDALASAGIPYETQSGSGFFHRPEVKDLTNLLAWLAEPADEIALLGVLRSPLFMFDDATLLTLRRWQPQTGLVPAGDSGGRPFIVALRDPPPSLEAAIAERARAASAILDRLAELASTESVDHVLSEALALTGAEASAVSLPGGARAVANMRKLVRMAQALSSRSIDEFVDYLVRRRDDLITRETQAVLDEPDAVRVLTVHGAKGLEFPVVFVPEVDQGPRADHSRVTWNRRLGLAVTLRRDDEDDDKGRVRPGFYGVLSRQDEAEDLAEHKRLFYVACTRARDYLFLSGDEPASAGGKGRWLDWIQVALAGVPDASIEYRLPLPVELDAVRRAESHGPVAPPESAEVDYVSPLLARPAVIPVRVSTPVTALLAERDLPRFGHGDGLASFRGVLAHRAIELTYGAAGCPPLAALAEQVRERPLSPVQVEGVVTEVGTYLALFAASALGRLLVSGGVEARFELPFAWDWDGVPVHGVIDLLYRDQAGAWHVVDFKTDSLTGRSAAEVVSPYLAQLGLYGLAVERAVGARPSLGACLLRSGELVDVAWEDVEPALRVARALVDAGVMVSEATEE